MKKLRLVKKPEGGNAKKTNPTKADLLSLKFRYESAARKKEKAYKTLDAILAFCPEEDDAEGWKKLNAAYDEFNAAVAEFKAVEAEILRRAAARG